jgi:cation diffusion facilitator family transporter
MSTPTHEHKLHAHDVDHHHEHNGHEHHHEHGHDHTHDHHEHEHKHGLWATIAQVLHLPGYSHSHASLAEDKALYHNDLALRTVWQALLILGLTTVLQFGVYLASESAALLGDTVHNLGDALNSVPLLLAFWLAKRKATRRYTYGYGRVEDIAGLIIVASIIFSAVYILIASIQRLHNPHIHNLEWVILASIIGFVGNEAVALLEIRVGRQIGSAAMIADGLHARTDGLTSLIVLAAAILTALNIPIADPILGIVIAVMIMFIAREAITMTWYRLTDAVDPTLVEKAEQAILSFPEVNAVQRLQLRWLGHELYAEVVLCFDSGLSMEQVAALTDSIRHKLHHALDKLGQVTLAVALQSHNEKQP